MAIYHPPTGRDEGGMQETESGRGGKGTRGATGETGTNGNTDNETVKE